MANVYTYSFERLHVWQLARILVKDIYIVTHTFPREERYGLILQLRRASISISSNLAEGTSRFSKKVQAYKVELSFGSLTEVINQLILSSDLEYITEEKLNSFRLQLAELYNKLNAFHASLIRRNSKPGKRKDDDKVEM